MAAQTLFSRAVGHHLPSAISVQLERVDDFALGKVFIYQHKPYALLPWRKHELSFTDYSLSELLVEGSNLEFATARKFLFDIDKGVETVDTTVGMGADLKEALVKLNLDLKGKYQKKTSITTDFGKITHIETDMFDVFSKKTYSVDTSKPIVKEAIAKRSTLFIVSTIYEAERSNISVSVSESGSESEQASAGDTVKSEGGDKEEQTSAGDTVKSEGGDKEEQTSAGATVKTEVGDKEEQAVATVKTEVGDKEEQASAGTTVKSEGGDEEEQASAGATVKSEGGDEEEQAVATVKSEGGDEEEQASAGATVTSEGGLEEEQASRTSTDVQVTNRAIPTPVAFLLLKLTIGSKGELTPHLRSGLDDHTKIDLPFGTHLDADKPPPQPPAADKPPATDKPADKPPATDKPADKPADKPPATDKPADKPADKPPATDKPADKPPATDKPADKPADKPPPTET